MIAAGLLTGQFPEHRAGCPLDPAFRQQEGCDGPRPDGVPSFEFEVDGEVIGFELCPLHYVDREILELVRWWRRSRHGLWPHGPAGLEQSATFLDAHDLLDRSVKEFLAERNNDGAET